MPQVVVRDKQIFVDDKAVPLFSGELHFWRMPRCTWEVSLRRMKEMGLCVVSTYVCWEYHELEPGRFDFRGETEPERDLVGFIELVRDMGMLMLLRPGPFIYAEWEWSGLPERVAPYLRVSEEYRRETEVYLKAVIDTAKPYFATNGGPIIACQSDNEMDLFCHWFEGELGFRGGDKFFQQFLREQYGDIEALNGAYESFYDSFEDVHVFAEPLNPMDRGDKVAALDYWRFRQWSVNQGCKWHNETYRKLGVDVPLYTNYYAGGDGQNWPEIAEDVDFVGIDTYPKSDFAYDSRSYRLYTDALRYQRCFSAIPYIAEFECGVWHGYHHFQGMIQPRHYRNLSYTALGAGIAGWSWYMLVERDNWYLSPIQGRGRVRGELFNVFKEITEVVNLIDPPTLTKLSGAAATVNPLHIANDDILAKSPVLNALYDTDVDYELFDLKAGYFKKPLVFYPGPNWLPEAEQRRLVEYVESGGTLVCFKTSPLMNEYFVPVNRLGVKSPVGVLSFLGKSMEVRIGDQKAHATGSVYEFDPTVGEPITATQLFGEMHVFESNEVLARNYQGQEFNCGYIEQRGKGRLIMLGLDPSPSLVRAIHRLCGVPLYAQSDVSSVHTFLFTRDDKYYLVATNQSGETHQAGVILDWPGFKPGRYVVTQLPYGSPVEVELGPEKKVMINVEGKSGGVWEIAGV